MGAPDSNVRPLRPGRSRVRRRAQLAFAALLAFAVGLVALPASSSALRAPRLPAVAGSVDPLAVAASEALAALWADDPSYADKVAVVVPLAAAAGKVPADQLAAAWAKAPRKRMLVLLSALTQVGVPYRARKATAGVGFDCSGLTSWAWAQVGKYLPHQSLRQIRAIPKSSKERILPADILYYPGHAMLALGVGLAMVHAPYQGKTMEVSPPTGRWARIVRVGSPDGQRAPLPPSATSTTAAASSATR